MKRALYIIFFAVGLIAVEDRYGISAIVPDHPDEKYLTLVEGNEFQVVAQCDLENFEENKLKPELFDSDFLFDYTISKPVRRVFVPTIYHDNTFLHFSGSSPPVVWN